MGKIRLKKKEVWRGVCGWEGLYEVSNWGRVKSLARWSFGEERKVWLKEKILKGTPHNHGYTMVALQTGDKPRLSLVHRLVLEAFKGVPPEDKPNCLHKDDDPTNNKLSNLYWGCQIDNWSDSHRNGTARPPVRAKVKAPDDLREKIRKDLLSGTFKPDLVEKYRLSRAYIDYICVGLKNPRGRAPRSCDLTYERQQEIYARRKDGLKLRELCDEFAVSMASASQICAKMRAHEAKGV